MEVSLENGVRMSFKIGDEVRVFQDTKSSISPDFYTRAVIVGLQGASPDDERFTLLFGHKGYKLFVHPDDFRPLTKLERVLK